MSIFILFFRYIYSERFHISSFILFVLAQNILEAEGPWFESFFDCKIKWKEFRLYYLFLSLSITKNGCRSNPVIVEYLFISLSRTENLSGKMSITPKYTVTLHDSNTNVVLKIICCSGS